MKDADNEEYQRLLTEVTEPRIPWVLKRAKCTYMAIVTVLCLGVGYIAWRLYTAYLKSRSKLPHYPSASNS